MIFVSINKKTLSIFVFLIIMLPKCEVKVEPSIILLHCRRKEQIQIQGIDLNCDIHGVTIKKPNSYEFKVACPFQNSNDRVQEIVFEKSKVEFLSKSLFNSLRSVQSAKIMDVGLKSIHPEAFVYAKNLEILDLSENLLEILGPKEFIGANNLKNLNLKGNQIHFIDDDAFNGLLALKILSLAENQLKSVNPSALTPLTNLIDLDVKGNHLSKSEQEFCNNRFFVTLNLNRNHIKDFKCNNGEIEKLKLAGNQIEYIPSFQSIKNIKVLDLSNNLIKKPEFPLLSNLNHVNLSRNPLQLLNEKSFQSVLNLKVLDISYCQLEELHADMLSILVHLEYLYIDGNSLTFFDFAKLKDTHANLKLVSIADNDWNCEYFDKILQTFCTTNVTIRYDNGVACKDLKGDVIIPIDRAPDQTVVNRRAAKFSEQLWFYFLLLAGASISFYLAIIVFKNYCLNRIMLS